MNYRLSFVQGRISAQIGSFFQYFPIDNWHNELVEAKKINLKNIEWVVSDLSNPIFSPIFSKMINQVLKKNNVEITSISLDYLMNRPLFNESIADLNWIIKKLNSYKNKNNKIRLNIPIEETSKIYNFSQVSKLVSKLSYIKKKISSKYILSLETDMSPQNLKVLLNKKQTKGIGVNIDLGNIEANGYDIKEYFSKLKRLIYGIHVKTRGPLFSKSKMLKQNEIFSFTFKNLNSLKNLHDITLQSFKDNKNYKKQIIQNFNFIKKLLKDERI